MSTPEGVPRPPELGVVPDPPPATDPVEAQAPAEPSAPAEPEHDDDQESTHSGGAGWLAGILGVVLAIAAVLLANEFQVNRQLEGSLNETRQALVAATGALEVYEQRMDEMRGSVGTIADQLGSLGQQVGALQHLLDAPVDSGDSADASAPR